MLFLSVDCVEEYPSPITRGSARLPHLSGSGRDAECRFSHSQSLRVSTRGEEVITFAILPTKKFPKEGAASYYTPLFIEPHAVDMTSIWSQFKIESQLRKFDIPLPPLNNAYLNLLT